MTAPRTNTIGETISAHDGHEDLPRDPTAEDAPDLCYSTDEENYNYETLGEAMDALDGDQGLTEGLVIYEGEAHRNAPSYYFDVDSLIEQMGERACDDAGEWADTFPDLSKEQVAELDSMIKTWLDANVTATFYTVCNTRKLEVTTEMIAEYRGDAPAAEGGQS
jgi:hypothetical protein